MDDPRDFCPHCGQIKPEARYYIPQRADLVCAFAWAATVALLIKGLGFTWPLAIGAGMAVFYKMAKEYVAAGQKRFNTERGYT